MITLVSSVGVRAALMPEMAVSSYTLTIARLFAMVGGITSGIWWRSASTATTGFTVTQRVANTDLAGSTGYA